MLTVHGDTIPIETWADCLRTAQWSVKMATTSPFGAISKQEEYARLGAALAAIAQRKTLLALPSPAMRHLLAKPRPAENRFPPPHIGARRPPYNF